MLRCESAQRRPRVSLLRENARPRLHLHQYHILRQILDSLGLLTIHQRDRQDGGEIPSDADTRLGPRMVHGDRQRLLRVRRCYEPKSDFLDQGVL